MGIALKNAIFTSLLLLLLLSVDLFAGTPTVGSLTNGKLRLYAISVQATAPADPLTVTPTFAVLQSALGGKKKYTIEWSVLILHDATVLQTLNAVQKVEKPYDPVVLPLSAVDISCGPIHPPVISGTTTYVSVPSTLNTPGNSQATGFRIEGKLIQFDPRTGKTTTISLLQRHCYRYDLTPPIIEISSVTNGEVRGSDVTPVITITDNVGGGVTEQTITLDGSPFTSGTTISAEGNHQISVLASDAAGNTASKDLAFSIDKSAPVILFGGVESDKFYAQPRTVTIDIQEPHLESSTILLDNQPFVSGTPVSAEGRHTLKISATDTLQHTSQKVLSFGIDTASPVITIRSPGENALVRFDVVQVTGSLQEQFLKEVTVNGIKAVASSDFFTVNNLHLSEGDNTITVVATDLAGNTDTKSVACRLDQTAPGVAILSPANGATLTDSLITVTGTVSGTDIRDVRVNGVPALLSGSAFTASNIRLSENTNTLRAIVTDTAGNSAEASVVITRDSSGPKIALTKPVDESITTQSSTPVSGYIMDTTPVTLKVNNAQVAVNQDGSFSTTVNLAEGANLISIVAMDQPGNESTAAVSVTRDSTGPTVLSILPSNSSIGVPPDQLISILFSEELKKSTVTPATVHLNQGANLIAGTPQLSGKQVTFQPQQPLSGSTPFTIYIEVGITDSIGNPLAAPAQSTFSTLDNVPPAPPTIESLPLITSETVITVVGTAEANSNVEITGGAAKVNVLADAGGNYSAQVNLYEDAVNQLSVTATDLAGNTSTPVTATIVQDSVRMTVVDAFLQGDGSVAITFSKPVSLASITQQNIYAIATSTVVGAVNPTADPATVLFYPQTSLTSVPFVIKVETSIEDQSGHLLEYPFSKLFNTAAGSSFVSGEVYDNASGLPLSGAQAQQLLPAVNPAPVATTDATGRFVLPTSSGNVVLRIFRSGYLPVDRAVDATAGGAVVMFDARLQPADSAALEMSSAGATLSNSDGSVQLIVPAGAVAGNMPVKISKRDGQSLPVLLPYGWSPAAAGSIDTTAVLNLPVQLRVQNDAGLAPFSSVSTAYFDAAVSQWRLGEPGFVSEDGKYVEVETTRPTTHAFLLPDPTNPPPDVQTDQPLLPSPLQGVVPAIQAAMVSTPTGIYPEQRALVQASFTGGELRSGTAYQAIISENFTLLAALGSVQTTPRTADLVAYSMGQPSTGKLQFYASPSKAVDFSKLEQGYIDVELHKYPHAAEQPGVIDSAGGTVNSAEGDLHLQIPAGALTTSVPVTLTYLRTNQITAALAGYTLVSAFEVSLAGAVLASPATIDAPATLPGTPQIILARLAQVGLRSLWVFEGTGSYDGARITSPYVRISGVFGIFTANNPIGYLTGSITDPQNAPAGAGIVVTCDQNPLAALSNAASVYTLAVPVSAGIATAANQISGDDGSASYAVNAAGDVVPLNLHIQTRPPYIVSIMPAGGVTGVDPNTAIRVKFSEAILASSLNSSSFYLQISSPISPSPGKILLTSNNTTGVFAPTAPLASDTQYTFVVTAGIKDLTNNSLSPASYTFHTADTTAPSGAGRFKLFLPENGNVRFEVPEEDIEAGTTIVFVNESHPLEDITATLQDGYWTASLAGTIYDKFYVLLIDAANNQTRIDFGLMEYPDGSGAVFPVEGGTYTTAVDKIMITVEEGTFTSATPVQVKLVPPLPVYPATPRDFSLLSYFTLNFNHQTPKKEITLSFPAPEGATPESQFFALEPVEVFGEKKWMAVEELKYADGMITTQSPPFKTLRKEFIDPTDGAIALAQAQVPMFFLVGTMGRIPGLLIVAGSDLVALLSIDYRMFVLALVAGRSYSLTAVDPQTGETIFEGTPVPPATDAQDTVFLQQPLSDDTSSSYLVGSSSPLVATAWRVGAAKGSVRDDITFLADDGNNDGVAEFQGNITVDGEPGSLPEGSNVSLYNAATGETVTDELAGNSSFSVSLPYTFGDPVSLVLAPADVPTITNFRLVFSEPIAEDDYSKILEFSETDDPGQTISFGTGQFHANQELEIKPASALKSDMRYTLVLKDIADLTGNTMKGEQKIDFHTVKYDISGTASDGKVNDSLLLRDHLLVAEDDRIAVYSTANPYDMEQTGEIKLWEGSTSLAFATDTTVVSVGGGKAPQPGLLRVIDFADFSNPTIVATFQLSKFLGDNDPARAEYPAATPIKVVVHRTHALVVDIGAGLQDIDLLHLDYPMYGTQSTPHRTYEEPYAKDIALYLKADLPGTPGDESLIPFPMLSGINMHDDRDNSLVAGKVVDESKVRNEVCKRGSDTTQTERCQIAKISSGPTVVLSENESVIAGITASGQILGPANNIEIFQEYEIDIDQDGKTGDEEDNDDLEDLEKVGRTIHSRRSDVFSKPRDYEIHDLAFIGSGAFGIYIVDITKLDSPIMLGRIKLPAGISATDMKLDRKNLRLYVPVGAEGIYIVDIKDPFLIAPDNPPQIIGKVEVEGAALDGNVAVDEELNTIYVATTQSGLKSVLVGPMQMGIFTKEGDKYKPVGIIMPEGIVKDPQTGELWGPGSKLSDMQQQDPTKYYVVAFLPSNSGGIGKVVKAKLIATNFFDQPIHLGAGYPDVQFPAEEQQEFLLRYQEPEDPDNDSYRLFVSDPFYITAHPGLPSQAKAGNSPIMAAGDYIKVELDYDFIHQYLDFVTTDLVRQSRFAAKTVRMDWVDSEKPESRQNPPTGRGETAYPPYLHSGEWSMPVVDFTIKGRGFDFVFARNYESQALYDGPLGNGWDHAYFARIQELPTGDVYYYDGMGRKELFDCLGEGCAGGYQVPHGNFVTLAKLEDGNWLITGTTGVNYLFNSYGQLSRIQDRNENKIEFFYSPSGQLSLAVDTMGRPIVYEYNDDGKLSSVRDFTGRQWDFHYDEDVESTGDRKPDLLTSVAGPVGYSLSYTYTSAPTSREDLAACNLEAVADSRGNEIIANSYNGEDQLTGQQYGDPVDQVTFSYAEGSATVNDRNGNQSSYVVDPQAGMLLSMTQPAEFAPATTGYLYNEDGLLTEISLPGGNSLSMGYEGAESDTNRRKAPNVTELKKIGGQTNLQSVFSYQGRYNLTKTATDPMGHTTEVVDFDSNDRNPHIVKRPGGEILTYNYNQFGQLESTIDTRGHITAYSYYPEISPSSVREDASSTTGGYLHTVTYDQTGQALTYAYSYDERGNITGIKDPRGFDTIYLYDEQDRVTDVTRSGIFHTHYTLDANGNVVLITMEKDPDEFSTVGFEYDSLNNIILKREFLSANEVLTTTYLYDGNRNLKSVIFPEGNRNEYGYGPRDLKITEAPGFGSAEQSVWQYAYDANKNLTQIVDERGTTRLLYDNLDRLVQTIYPEGNTRILERDLDGLPRFEKTYDSVNGTLLAQKDYQYNDRHLLLIETDHLLGGPGGDALLDTTYGYDADNLLQDVSDPKHRTTHYDYDGAHRRIKTTDPAGNFTEYGYDGNDNVTSITGHLLPSPGSSASTAVYTTTNKYDLLNRLTESYDTLQHKTTFGYDLRNNLLFTVDATGGVRSNKYDNLNRRIFSRTVTGDADVTVDYKYDGNGRLTSYKDATDSETVYKYDALNRNKEIDYPNGGTVHIGYDGNDNVTTTTDRNGTTVTNDYDDNNRLISRTIAPGAGVIGTTSETYKYDGLNRVTEAANNDATVKLRYDSRGLPWKDEQGHGTSEMRYDEVGNKTKVMYPGNTLTMDRAYDEVHRLSDINGGEIGDVLGLSYLGSVRITDKTWGNSIASKYQYDSDGRLFDIAHGPADQPLIGFGYQWDDAHYRTAEVKHHLADAADTFVYDTAHRVKNATLHLGTPDPQNRSFGYDAADTITTAGNDAGDRFFSTNAEHQYVSEGSLEFDYDGNGNLTRYKSGVAEKHFAYDYLNRLMHAEVVNGAQTKNVDFKYDALGRRISKTTDTSTTNYVYEQLQVVQETDASGAVQREYIWGDSIDELLAIRQNGQTYNVLENSIGSVAGITDSTGALVERYDYDVFGMPTVTNSDGSATSTFSFLGQPYSYQGHEYDTETGLFYFRARYYDPSLGRFISVDPEGYSDSPNLYQAFLNSPANFTDPMGKDVGDKALYGWDSKSIRKSSGYRTEQDLIEECKVPAYLESGGQYHNWVRTHPQCGDPIRDDPTVKGFFAHAADVPGNLPLFAATRSISRGTAKEDLAALKKNIIQNWPEMIPGVNIFTAAHRVDTAQSQEELGGAIFDTFFNAFTTALLVEGGGEVAKGPLFEQGPGIKPGVGRQVLRSVYDDRAWPTVRKGRNRGLLNTAGRDWTWEHFIIRQEYINKYPILRGFGNSYANTFLRISRSLNARLGNNTLYRWLFRGAVTAGTAGSGYGGYKLGEEIMEELEDGE